MPKLSAAIALYKIIDSKPCIFLVHPGGPFWAKKDDGAWSLPKGEYNEDEQPLQAAKREFQEETGQALPEGDLLPLGSVAYANKKVSAWALQGDINENHVVSNTFELEWPPRSGTIQQFAEVDRAGWFDLQAARQKLVKGQVPFIDTLEEALRATVEQK